MSRTWIVVGMSLALVSTASASPKLSTIKRDWRAALSGIGAAANANVRLRGVARQVYRELNLQSFGEGSVAIGMKNLSGRKDTVAGKTFAIYMHYGVGDHLRVFDRSTQRLVASGNAVDGPFRWDKTPTR